MNLNELQDEQLMLRVAQEDKDALAVLYDRHSSAVMGLAYRFLKNRQIAEEVVQETFWRVWDKAKSFDAQKGSCTNWLFSIARRYAIDLIRRSKSRPLPAGAESEVEMMQKTPSSENVFKKVAKLIQSDRVKEALQNLPPEQLEVIQLAYFKGLTRREIAQETETPVGTVHTRARLALRKLQLLLVET